MSLIERAVQMWRDPHARLLPPFQPSSLEVKRAYDVTVPISYGATHAGLATATFHNFVFAMRHCKGQGLLVFGNCPYVFPGAEHLERQQKMRILRDWDFPEHHAVDAGLLINSVTEGLNVNKALDERGIHPRSILVVTGEMDTRSARFIFEKLFPEAKIEVAATQWRDEFQLDHPVLVQRSAWTWLFANIARQALLRTVGFRIAGLHHRTSAT